MSTSVEQVTHEEHDRIDNLRHEVEELQEEIKRRKGEQG